MTYSPTAPGVSEMDNKLDIPIGIFDPEEGALKHCPELTFDLEKGSLGSFLFPMTATTRSLSDLPPHRPIVKILASPGCSSAI